MGLSGTLVLVGGCLGSGAMALGMGLYGVVRPRTFFEGGKLDRYMPDDYEPSRSMVRLMQAVSALVALPGLGLFAIGLLFLSAAI